MKIRIRQTGLREFTDTYEFDLTDEQVAELKQNLRSEGRTLSDFDERDAYDLGFELAEPVQTELGDIVEDSAEAELISTKRSNNLTR